MTIKERYNAWKERNYLDNVDVAVMGGFATITTGLFGLIVYAGVQEVKKEKEQDTWARQKYDEGKHVYQLANGALIATDEIEYF